MAAAAEVRPRPARFLAFARLGLAFALLHAGALGRATAQQTYPQTSTESAPAPSAHERMLAVLKDIADHSSQDNPFMSEKRVLELRARWAAKKGGTLERWTIGRQLGNAELEQGHEQAAIEALSAATEAVDAIPFEKIERSKLAPARPDSARADIVDARTYYHNLTWFELGVAYMRYGETQNCCLKNSAESCIMPLHGAALHTATDGSLGAIRCFTEVMQHRPAKPEPLETKDCLRRAQWLLNVAYMTLGKYPADVPKDYLVDVDKLFPCAVDFPPFENVLPALGLDTFDLSGGTIIDDFDGDHDLDILLSCWDTRGPMHYFVNNGDGTFTDRTKEANLTGLYGGLNMTQADYDNDGDLDVLVPRGAWMREYGKHPASLLQNDGHGVFTDVSFEAGFERARFPGKTAAWADYDLDGDLDVYLGFDFGQGYEDALPQLYRNNGDGTFSECAAAAGVRDPLFVMGASWGDYDEDRYPDLYVAAASNNVNDQLSHLYHNNKDGTFTDVTSKAGVRANNAPFPCWFFDYDDDGHMDLYVSCRAGTVAVLADPELRNCRDSLFKGDGHGAFVDVGHAAGLDHPALPMGSNFGDLNGDGYLDMYLGTGFADYAELHPNVMYLNLGPGADGAVRFTDVTMKGGFGHLQKGHGVSFADLDNDGDQDVYIQMGGAFPGDKFNDALFENPGFGNHWLALEFEGVQTNRCAIGARIRADIVDNGVARSVYRNVNSGGSYGSDPLRQNIGLGRATIVATLTIDWPVSNQKQVFHDVPVDRFFRIVEGPSGQAGALRALTLERLHLGGTLAPAAAAPAKVPGG